MCLVREYMKKRHLCIHIRPFGRTTCAFGDSAGSNATYADRADRSFAKDVFLVETKTPHICSRADICALMTTVT